MSSGKVIKGKPARFGGRSRAWKVAGNAYLFGLMSFMVVSSPFFMLIVRRQDARFRNRLARQGRLLRLEDVEQKARAGQGLLLVEIDAGPSGFFKRTWWLPKELIDTSSCPLPVAGHTPILATMRDYIQPNPARIWGESNLIPLARRAFLVQLKRNTWPEKHYPLKSLARMIDRDIAWKFYESSQTRQDLTVNDFMGLRRDMPVQQIYEAIGMPASEMGNLKNILRYLLADGSNVYVWTRSGRITRIRHGNFYKGSDLIA
ncbi:MAG TPA: hypothetical protein VL992_09835 [Tepidisphaeraceae bacterium]|nr:hypothetical protein [Tepidisphaeraceae bacterium]